MKIEDTLFTDLIPFTSVIEKYARSPLQLKKFLVAGIRKKLKFYAVNQSLKRVHMIRWREIEIDHPPYFDRLHGKPETLYVFKGKMLPIAKIHQFDKLFKGVLNEIDLFEDIEGFDELVEYQKPNFNRELFHQYAGESGITPPSEFNKLSYSNVFIVAKDLVTIDELLNQKETAKLTIQNRRELVFIDWLKDKDEQVVRNMKKDYVWEQLRSIDPHLFVSEPKAFFRVQQIITFKSGRKATQED